MFNYLSINTNFKCYSVDNMCLNIILFVGETMIWRARNFRDKALEENAKALKTPSCDALNELYSTERGW